MFHVNPIIKSGKVFVNFRLFQRFVKVIKLTRRYGVKLIIKIKFSSFKNFFNLLVIQLFSLSSIDRRVFDPKSKFKATWVLKWNWIECNLREIQANVFRHLFQGSHGAFAGHQNKLNYMPEDVVSRGKLQPMAACEKNKACFCFYRCGYF